MMTDKTQNEYNNIFVGHDAKHSEKSGISNTLLAEENEYDITSIKADIESYKTNLAKWQALLDLGIIEIVKSALIEIESYKKAIDEKEKELVLVLLQKASGDIKQ